MISAVWSEAHNAAHPEQIMSHFGALDANFQDSLRKRVNLSEYSAKIFGHAERFEAWHSKVLIGLVAMYANSPDRESAYITSVSVLPEWQGQGVASSLLNRAIEFAAEEGFEFIRLEVAQSNSRAIRRYVALGFSVVDELGGTCEMILHLMKR